MALNHDLFREWCDAAQAGKLGEHGELILGGDQDQRMVVMSLESLQRLQQEIDNLKLDLSTSWFESQGMLDPNGTGSLQAANVATSPQTDDLDRETQEALSTLMESVRTLEQMAEAPTLARLPTYNSLSYQKHKARSKFSVAALISDMFSTTEFAAIKAARARLSTIGPRIAKGHKPAPTPPHAAGGLRANPTNRKKPFKQES